MNYKAKAKKLWGKQSPWIDGNGRFALLAHCRTLTVSLHSTIEKAQSTKNQIDEFACGGMCCRNHEIIDLDTL